MFYYINSDIYFMWYFIYANRYINVAQCSSRTSRVNKWWVYLISSMLYNLVANWNCKRHAAVRTRLSFMMVFMLEAKVIRVFYEWPLVPKASTTSYYDWLTWRMNTKNYSLKAFKKSSKVNSRFMSPKCDTMFPPQISKIQLIL